MEKCLVPSMMLKWWKTMGQYPRWTWNRDKARRLQTGDDEATTTRGPTGDYHELEMPGKHETM